MITKADILRAASLLDEEYEKEIKPMYREFIEAYEALYRPFKDRNVVAVLNRHSARLSKLNPKSIGIEALVNLTYSGDRAGAYAPNLVDLCGYSTSYCPSGTLKELFERLGFDSDRTAYDKVIAVKKIFLGAKAAFEIFVNDGAKKIAEFVEKNVAVVLEQDKEDTKEFNELFGFPKKSRGVKITVTVENI